MATASVTTADVPADAPIPTVPPPPLDPGEMAVEMSGLTWDDFETIARIKGDRRAPRLIYSSGELSLVSPLYAHEGNADHLDVIVKAVCYELGIPYIAAGATLFRRRDLDKGIEGDRTYYIASERAIREKTELDLQTDPPPDLVIEVEVTHPARAAVETWCKLGVPEVWVYSPRKNALRIVGRDAEGRYQEVPASLSFPFLRAEEILRWACRPGTESQFHWERRLRAWIRDELAPRFARPE
jgi:Uma2 family endonuclease